jgi:hypothetical protein
MGYCGVVVVVVVVVVDVGVVVVVVGVGVVVVGVVVVGVVVVGVVVVAAAGSHNIVESKSLVWCPVGPRGGLDSSARPNVIQQKGVPVQTRVTRVTWDHRLRNDSNVEPVVVALPDIGCLSGLLPDIGVLGA